MDPKNEEFLALIKAAGWSQAEAARRLHIRPSSVSEMCSGKIKPSTSTLNLLKLVVAGEKPDALKTHEQAYAGGLEPWAKDLVEELRRLPAAQREQVLPVIRHMIQTVSGQALKARKTR